MRLTVFGGTGPTGAILIDRALEAGHEVVAHARNPGRIEPRQRLRIVEGELADAVSIRGAITGADAVLSLLGPSTDRSGSAALVEGYRSIVAAMDAAAVTRLVLMGTPSMSDPGDERDPRIRAMVAGIRLLQPHAYRALGGIAEVVRASDLDWTIVRFPLLTDGPATGAVRVRRVGEPGGLRLSRANAAAYFLGQVDAVDQLRRAPLLSDR